MQETLMVYFGGEKSAGLFLAGVGIAIIAAAIVLFRDFRSFAITLVEMIELALIVGFAIVAIVMMSRAGFVGVALGLVMHAAVLLAFDLLAEPRSAVYLDAIAQGDRA
jgi:hypothetical protein